MTTVDDTAFIREKLIVGGLDLVDSDGTEALSVRRLAQAAGRTSMCVYSKFGSRGGLLMAMYDRVARELMTALAVDPAADLEKWANANHERYAFLFDAELTSMGIDPGMRRSLLEDVVARVGSEDTWALAHGRIAAERIRGA